MLYNSLFWSFGFVKNKIKGGCVSTMKLIPVHLLSEQAGLKIDIMRFELEDAPYVYDEINIQRNDHYVFLLFEKGTARLMVDFEKITLIAGSIYYAFPGQIHHRIYDQQVQGWYLAVDTLLVSTEFRNIFEGKLGLQSPLTLNSKLFNQCNSILGIINNRIGDENYTKFDSQVTNTLLQSFIGIVAGGYSQQHSFVQQKSRPEQITHQFKMMLAENFRSLKSPSAYAQRLNITKNYLNETIKKNTGFPVSYWITNEVLMEAKRLLFHTTLDVKEIAYAVGYDDPAYFSKLFKKHEGLSPLCFRNKKH